MTKQHAQRFRTSPRTESLLAGDFRFHSALVGTDKPAAGPPRRAGGGMVKGVPGIIMTQSCRLGSATRIVSHKDLIRSAYCRGHARRGTHVCVEGKAISRPESDPESLVSTSGTWTVLLWQSQHAPRVPGNTALPLTQLQCNLHATVFAAVTDHCVHTPLVVQGTCRPCTQATVQNLQTVCLQTGAEDVLQELICMHLQRRGGMVLSS
jgi:hypothetical protein